MDVNLKVKLLDNLQCLHRTFCPLYLKVFCVKNMFFKRNHRKLSIRPYFTAGTCLPTFLSFTNDFLAGIPTWVTQILFSLKGGRKQNPVLSFYNL